MNRIAHHRLRRNKTVHSLKQGFYCCVKTVAALTFLTFIFSSSAFSQENSIERAQRVSTKVCSKAEDYDLCMLELSMALGAAYQDGLIVSGCKLGLDEPSKDKCENSERFGEYIIKEIRNYAKKM